MGLFDLLIADPGGSALEVRRLDGEAVKPVVSLSHDLESARSRRIRLVDVVTTAMFLRRGRPLLPGGLIDRFFLRAFWRAHSRSTRSIEHVVRILPVGPGAFRAAGIIVMGSCPVSARSRVFLSCHVYLPYLPNWEKSIGRTATLCPGRVTGEGSPITVLPRL